MNYSDRLKYIQKYLTNEMSSSEKDGFFTWLKESNENQILFDQLSDIWDNAPTVQKEEFNYENAFGLHMAKLNIDSGKTEKGKIISLINIKAIAAVMILVLLSTVVFKWMNNGDIYRANSESVTITLDDGTKVWLDKGSELEVSDFDGDSRFVRLTGKAFFDVSPNKNAAFVIETDGVGIKVLGTQFLVDTKSNIVKVKEGKVEVTHKEIAVVLTENQSVSIEDNHLSDVKTSNFDNSQLWFNEELVFDNVAFDKVIFDISKEYKLSIELPSKNSWTECLFTSGSLKGNTFDQILIILEVTYELEFSKINNSSYKFTKVNCK